jgi:hypothetical protein
MIRTSNRIEMNPNIGTRTEKVAHTKRKWERGKVVEKSDLLLLTYRILLIVRINSFVFPLVLASCKFLLFLRIITLIIDMATLSLRNLFM